MMCDRLVPLTDFDECIFFVCFCIHSFPEAHAANEPQWRKVQCQMAIEYIIKISFDHFGHDIFVSGNYCRVYFMVDRR